MNEQKMIEEMSLCFDIHNNIPDMDYHYDKLFYQDFFIEQGCEHYKIDEDTFKYIFKESHKLAVNRLVKKTKEDCMRGK